MCYRLGWIAVFILFSLTVAAQVGERVTEVKVLNVKNDTVNLPLLGEKALIIFYQDPSHADENSNLQDYFKAHPVTGTQLESYGVVNMAAAPMIPNGLIKRMARKRIKGTKAQVYFDPDSILHKAWHLPGADKASCVICVGKNRTIDFYKAGQVTDAEMQQVIEWAAKNE